MTEKDIRMLKAVKYLLDKGTFQLKLREGPALVEVIKWISEIISAGPQKKTTRKKKKTNGNK